MSTRTCQSTTSATLWAYHGSQLTATNRQARPRTSANQFNSIDVDATMPIDYVRHIMGVSWIAPSTDSDKPSSPATDVSNRATRSRSAFLRGLLAGHPDSLRQTLMQFRSPELQIRRAASTSRTTDVQNPKRSNEHRDSVQRRLLRQSEKTRKSRIFHFKMNGIIKL